MANVEFKGRRMECNPYVVGLSFDGAPAVLHCRLFIEEGKVIGVRSLRLLTPNGPPIPRLDSGKYVDETSMLADAKEQADVE